MFVNGDERAIGNRQLAIGNLCWVSGCFARHCEHWSRLSRAGRRRSVRGASSEVFTERSSTFPGHGERPGIGGATTVGREMNGMYCSSDRSSKLFIGFIKSSIQRLGLWRVVTIEAAGECG